MNKALWFVPLIALVLMACASVNEQQRVDRFNETARAYRWALLDSDFRAAAKFIDPKVPDNLVDQGIYNEVRIVDVTISNSETTHDGHRIEQDVELSYYLLNRSILKETRSRQVWQYDPAHKIWMLNTPLPIFER